MNPSARCLLIPGCYAVRPEPQVRGPCTPQAPRNHGARAPGTRARRRHERNPLQPDRHALPAAASRSGIGANRSRLRAAAERRAGADVADRLFLLSCPLASVRRARRSLSLVADAYRHRQRSDLRHRQRRHSELLQRARNLASPRTFFHGGRRHRPGPGCGRGRRLPLLDEHSWGRPSSARAIDRGEWPRVHDCRRRPTRVRGRDAWRQRQPGMDPERLVPGRLSLL